MIVAWEVFMSYFLTRPGERKCSLGVALVRLKGELPISEHLILDRVFEGKVKKKINFSVNEEHGLIRHDAG
jgi:hypothetical protein